MQGRPDLAAECELAAKSVGDDLVRVRVTARDFMVTVVQQLREAGKLDESKAIEALLQKLKDGKHRKIIGGFQIQAGTTPGEILGQAEDLAATVIKAQGG